jgi:hypothetical protein
MHASMHSPESNLSYPPKCRCCGRTPTVRQNMRRKCHCCTTNVTSVHDNVMLYDKRHKCTRQCHAVRQTSQVYTTMSCCTTNVTSVHVRFRRPEYAQQPSHQEALIHISIWISMRMFTHTYVHFLYIRAHLPLYMYIYINTYIHT